MAKKRPQVALVYDFDGTLSPGNMQEFGFIQATGKTKDEFWEKNRKFAEGKDANGQEEQYLAHPGIFSEIRQGCRTVPRRKTMVFARE